MKNGQRMACFIGAALLLFPFRAMSAEPELRAPEIASLSLEGTAGEDHLQFRLRMEVRVEQAGVRLLLAKGAIAHQGAALPRGATLEREGDAFYARFSRRGDQIVGFDFAARAQAQDAWREARVELSPAAIRRVTLLGAPADREIRFEGALDSSREIRPDGESVFTAYLPPQGPLVIRWKPEVRALTGDLVATCDADLVAIARVGALQLDSLLQYRISQGQLQSLEIAIPAALTLLQVNGEDIREWTVEKAGTNQATLRVALSRAKTGSYALQLIGETALPAFPGTFSLPVPVPK
ncbi:MAG: hypothetical protein U1E27_04130, partial [Kiritimatiellia bacterium]|nr:hypothetical protein [Kiritimatiellia bacterium]